jgi:hypothetical protein
VVEATVEAADAVVEVEAAPDAIVGVEEVEEVEEVHTLLLQRQPPSLSPTLLQSFAARCSCSTQFSQRLTRAHAPPGESSVQARDAELVGKEL